MTCPRQDGELIEKKVVRPGDTQVTYYSCPACHGHWLRAFDVNFLPLVAAREIEDQGRPEPSSSSFPHSTGEQLSDQAQGKPESIDYLNNSGLHLTEESYGQSELRHKHDEKVVHPSDALACPSCGFRLKRAAGANIPDNVLAFHCPNGHGYYFPAGELIKFKVAQEAKIEYHKAWDIPLPSVAATLLSGLIGIILSVGLVIGVIGGRQQQIITSQAAETITFQHAYVAASTKSVTFIVGTSVQTTLTLHLSQTTATTPLQSVDGKSHVLRVTGVASGSYEYYFTFEAGGKPLRSETYSFVMP